jgi:hypothetical protein
VPEDTELKAEIKLEEKPKKKRTSKKRKGEWKWWS